MADQYARDHRPEGRGDIVVAAAIIGIGLVAIAIALMFRDSVADYGLGVAVIAAGAFVGLGIGVLGISKLAELHARADEALDEALGRAQQASAAAEKAEILRHRSG
ncbi:MAG: hypothetical protein ACREER_05990 [Alphaproteobacteria bacterium]